MYIVLNDDNKLIAFHDEKRVVKTYVENYNRNNDEKLSFRKVKRSKIKKELKNKEDLYLVKYRSTYIQSKYYDSMEISETDILDELQSTKDVLYRILELDYKNLSNKEIKHLESTIKILEERISDELEYTPCVRELNEIKENIEYYQNKFY